MKKNVLIIVLVLLALVIFTTVALADKPIKTDTEGNEIAWETTNISCTTIQSGELDNSAGDTITTGYDQWGYNYQAHMFNGGYCDAYRDAAWCQDYKDDDLI